MLNPGELPPEFVSLARFVSRASAVQCRAWDVATRDSGEVALLMVYEPNSTYQHFFSSGYFQSLEAAIEFMADVMADTEEFLMNVIKNDTLFPNIRGVMLKERRVTLTLSGKAKITETRDGDARVELFFSDHGKTAVVNRTQVLILVDLYGPETNDWEGHKVVLYGEEGTWFGKHTWGIRIDADASRRADAAARKNGKASKASGEAQQAALIDPGSDAGAFDTE